jgi:outer membrane protein assembly factor BamD (BamD/ComL family)
VQQYAIELELLQPARRSIATGSFSQALAELARHQREYPTGQLAQEREALRVRALWGTGQRAEAEQAAAVFRKRYPRSALLNWMNEPSGRAP